MTVTVSLDNQVQAWLASQSKTGGVNVDYTLVDHSDGNGPQIGSWDATKLGTKPTTDQLASVATAAQAIATAATNAILCDKVDDFRDARLAAGFADTGAGGTGKTLQCDAVSQGKWTAIGASAGFAIIFNTSPAPSYEIRCADNSTVSLTPAQALALFNARVMPWVSATALFAGSMKDAILAGNPPADITQGWP